MYKKVIKLSLVSSIIASSVLFASQDNIEPSIESSVIQSESAMPQIELKNDFEKEFVETYGVQTIATVKAVIAGKGRVEPSMITLISLNDDNSGLKKIYFTLGNEIKNIVYVSTDFKKVVLGEIVDLATLSSDTMNDFENINAEALKMQEKAKAAEEALKVPRTKALLDGIHDGSLGANLEYTLNGGNKDGETIVLFTDPLCPFCMKFEEERLPEVLKNSKEVRVVMYPLTSLRGHETSMIRGYWAIQSSKGKKLDEKLKILNQASHSDISKIKVDQNSKEFKEYVENMKKIQDMRIVPGTPSIYTADGIKK